MSLQRWPYEEQTYVLRKHIFAVRNQLKAGWPEQIYHHALERSLRSEGIPVQSKLRRTLRHRGVEIHLFEPDLIVWNEIILELKTLPYNKEFATEHYAQLIHYLKFFQMELGLLVNFAPKRVRIKRVIWTEPPHDVHMELPDDYAGLPAREKTITREVQNAATSLLAAYGLGYADTIYRKLLAVELQSRSFSIVNDAEVAAQWREKRIAYYRTPCLLIDNRLLLHVCAVSNFPPSYEFTRLKTYLENSGLAFGLLINFGRKQLQIYGVSPT